MTAQSTICQVAANNPTPTPMSTPVPTSIPTSIPTPSCQQPAQVPVCAAGSGCSGCAPGAYCCPASGGCNATYSGICEFSTCMSDPSTICQVAANDQTPTPTPMPTPSCEQPAQVPVCAAGSGCSGCAPGAYCCPASGGCNATYSGICEFSTCMSDPSTICQVASPAATPTPSMTPTPGGPTPTPGGQAGHPITVINNCTEAVWVGIQSSVMSGGFKLESTAQRVITAPIGWNSGTIWARTNCNFSGTVCAKAGPNNQPPADCCDTGGCTDGSDKFALRCVNSPAPPVTLAEFTLDSGGSDTYDVSMVSGGNVGVSIVPSSSTYTIQPGIEPNGPSCTTNADCNQASSFTDCVPALGCVDPFYCASPGCSESGGCAAPGLQQSLLAASTWGGTASNLAIPQSSCSTEIQYLSQQNQGSTYVGCITPQKFCRAACSTAQACPAPFTCGSAGFCLLPSGAIMGANCDTGVGDTTNLQLWGCTGVNAASCFTAGVNSDCCGCPSWAPASDCVNNNPYWQSNAAPIFATFHTAAPTVYSFPYDDKLSTFTCDPAAGQTTAYTVTFCPQGDSDDDGIPNYLEPGDEETGSGLTSDGCAIAAPGAAASWAWLLLLPPVVLVGRRK